MKCGRCSGRDAEVHIRQQKGKEVVEYHLCRDCAEQMAKDGLIPDMSFDFPLESFLSGLFPGPASGGQEDEEGNSALAGLACGRCGLDHSAFRRSGKYGCSDCFAIFHDSLGPLLRKIHGFDIHRGIRPKTACNAASCADDAETLREELRQAIEKEEYERAAVIRDRIRGTDGDHENRS
ncbi:MAG: UvrB/UvrC motif-containing protein [Thermovirgaceae bacterium]|nr:UvrB/UvrC motif-containing protein [Thermovirgaceae bacterium]